MKNDDFYQTLENQFKKIGYGSANIGVQLHEGQVVYVTTDNFSTKKYKGDGTAEAVGGFLKRVERNRKEKKTGTVTFVLDLFEGEAKRSVVQTNFKKRI